MRVGWVSWLRSREGLGGARGQSRHQGTKPKTVNAAQHAPRNRLLPGAGEHVVRRRKLLQLHQVAVQQRALLLDERLEHGGLGGGGGVAGRVGVGQLQGEVQAGGV